MSRLLLYSLPNSFYSARCRAVVYAREIALKIMEPPGGLGSAQFRAISPLGKIPALSTPAGVLIESHIICEYFEHVHPTPALLPSDAWCRAGILLLCRYVDLHLAPPSTPIWRRLRAAGLQSGVTPNERTTVELRLAEFESLLRAARIGGPISPADCASLPVLFLYRQLFALSGEDDPLTPHPALRARFDEASQAPSLERVLAEMEPEIRRRKDMHRA